MAFDISKFIGSTVVERAIEYRGDTATFYFRELSAAEAEDLFLGFSDKDGIKKGMRSKLIATVLCDADGVAIATPEDIDKIPNSLATKLQTVVLEINMPDVKDTEKN